MNMNSDISCSFKHASIEFLSPFFRFPEIIEGQQKKRKHTHTNIIEYVWIYIYIFVYNLWRSPNGLDTLLALFVQQLAMIRNVLGPPVGCLCQLLVEKFQLSHTTDQNHTENPIHSTHSMDTRWAPTCDK